MATINLGKVKGEPFRYEDFTPEQLEALKGKDFKYEDFSPEQLDGLKSKVKIGTVETLDADQKATVTSSVDGNVTTLNIGIPRGNGVNSYSGTREEYEDIADTIKDGSLVNITDENDFDDENLIGQVTMQRLNDIEDNFDNIKPHALANPTNNLLATEPGTPLDAVQGKVLNDLISRMQNLLPLMQVASYGDDDFNNHPVNKIVQVGKSSGILNGPLGATSFYGMSTIIKSYFGYGYQLAVKVGSDAAISGVYIRFNDAKNWGTWKTLVTETELNNILGNYSLTTYSINSNISYGLYILFGVAGRNGDVDAISGELKNLGFTTMDNTINDLISILTSNGTNKKQQYIRLEVNHNTSNFNKSLPGAKSANVLEIHLQGNGRGYVRCFYLSDATEYTANILNGVIGEWWKTEKTKVQ